METSHVRLLLDSQEAERRVRKFALDAETVRDSWSGLPSDMRRAQTEMLRIGQVQQRVGHLRRGERHAFRDHQEYVNRSQERVARTIERLRVDTRRDRSLSERYQGLQSGGGLTKALRADPAMAVLHGQMTQLRRLEAQQRATAGTETLLDRWNVTGGVQPLSMARYHGQSMVFGRSETGAPRTVGQWASSKARGALGSVGRTARQVTGIFTAFQGIQGILRSMSAFEERAMTIQDLGAQLGARFQYVADSLDGPEGLRQRFKYTLGELRPGLTELGRMTGSLEGADSALAMARGTGLPPSAVLSMLGRGAIYGPVNPDLLERTMRATGMRNRPQAYLQWWTRAQAQLGAGHLTVPNDAAASYMAFVSNAMGEPYRNQRGAALTQRLIGGVRAPGSGAAHAAKMHAVRGLGAVDLGGGVTADTGTYWGMQMAAESGSPRVLEALFNEAVRLGGSGDMGVSVFHGLLGGRVNSMETMRLFQGMQRSGGRMPTAQHLATFPNLDTDRAAVQTQTAYELASLRVGMETDAYEKIGAKLMPIAMDFKDAALALASSLGETTDAMGFMGNFLSGLAGALDSINVKNRSDATPWLFDAAMFFRAGDLASFGALKTLLAAIQGGRGASDALKQLGAD